jgi:dihydrofolate reductase
MIITAIVAVASNGVIGKDNNLPWRLPADLAFFKRTTSGHHIILGRKNYQSIGRPLPNRVNIVLSRDPDLNAPGCMVLQSLEEAIALARNAGESECFIVGGAEIYRQALPLVSRLYLTRIEHDFEGDVVLPDLGEGWKEVWSEYFSPDDKNHWPFRITCFERAAVKV